MLRYRLAACIANGGVLGFIGPHIPKGMTRAQFAASSQSRIRCWASVA